MLILVLVVLSVFSSCIAQNGGFDYRTFNDKQANFKFNGDAALRNPNTEDQLVITASSSYLAGSIFFANVIELTPTASFSTAFSFQMLDGFGADIDGAKGADGIVFIINSKTNAMASTGSGLGYGGLANSLGVEFDTWNNYQPIDPNGNHIGIDINGNVKSVATYTPPNLFNPNGNRTFVNYAWIDYTGVNNTLQVRYSTNPVRPAEAVITYNINLINILGVSKVYIGFSAATGSYNEKHIIKSWSFDAPLGSTPVCGNLLIENGEQCDGGSCCQSDCTFAPLNTVCRSSSGLCDAAETCSGNSSSCPTDVVSASSVVCRAAVGSCDVEEKCDGTRKICPTDQVMGSGTVCRESAGDCDVAETCDGSSNTCANDTRRQAGTVCRESAGVCDVAETCNGADVSCPTDGKDSTSVCRTSSGVCDAAETCDGINNACPSDTVRQAGTVCRASSGVCDVAETCDGSNKECANDVVRQNGTICRASTGVCDAAETCNGADIACPTDAPRKCPYVECDKVGDGYFCNADSGYTLCANGYAYKFACAAGTGCYCGFSNECNTPCTSGCNSSPSVESMTGAQRFCQDRINLFGEHGYFCNADGAGFYQCVRDPYCTSKASIQSALHSCSTGTVCKCADTRTECTSNLTTSPCVFPEDSETRF